MDGWFYGVDLGGWIEVIMLVGRRVRVAPCLSKRLFKHGMHASISPHRHLVQGEKSRACEREREREIKKKHTQTDRLT